MKIYISTPGDPSVGIWGDAISIDMNREYPQDTQEREDVRKQLFDFFNDFCDNGKPRISFDDECPDCGSKKMKVAGRLSEVICPNLYCPSRMIDPS